MNDPFVPHELPWFPMVQTFPVKPEAEAYCLTKGEVLAMRALKEGNANSYQQQMGIKALIEKVCATHDMTFRPGDDRASAFAEGRRFVGLMIIRAINLPFKASGEAHATGTTTSPDTADATGTSRKRRTPRARPGTRTPGAERA